VYIGWLLAFGNYAVLTFMIQKGSLALKTLLQKSLLKTLDSTVQGGK